MQKKTGHSTPSPDPFFPFQSLSCLQLPSTESLPKITSHSRLPSNTFLSFTSMRCHWFEHLFPNASGTYHYYSENRSRTDGYIWVLCTPGNGAIEQITLPAVHKESLKAPQISAWFMWTMPYFSAKFPVFNSTAFQGLSLKCCWGSHKGKDACVRDR